VSWPRSRPLPADDDASLSRLAAAGDRRAFHQLVLRHEARLRGFLGRVAGGAEGDELAQEALLRAWQRGRDYRGDGSWFGWVAGIGWRLFLDRRRRAARQAGWLAIEHAEVATSMAAESGAALDLARLFGQLGDAERAALTLCLGHGHSHAEAAAILGLPLGTVKSLVLRGRDKLQRLIAAGERT
jgi:RNA polymerase sigma factor (sigma-70 family)